LVSIIVVIISLYFSYKIFLKLTRDLDEIKEIKKGNIAVGLFLASVMIGIGLILFKTIYPIMGTFNTYIIKSDVILLNIAKWLGYMLLYLFLSLSTGILSVWFSIKVFCNMTKDIDEMKEIKNNNIAVAIFVAAIVLIVAYFIGNGISSLLAGIIPNPSLGIIDNF